MSDIFVFCLAVCGCPLLQQGPPANVKPRKTILQPEVSGGAATTTSLKKKQNNVNDATSMIASRIAVVNDHLGSDAYGKIGEGGSSAAAAAAATERLEDLELGDDDNDDDGDKMPPSKTALRAEQQRLILSEAMKQLGCNGKLTPQESRLWGTAFSLCDVRGQH